MKIVILDGFTSVRDDLNWDNLKEFAEVVAYERTKPDQLLERSKDADAIFTNKVVFNESHFAQLPKLKYIGILATGFNNIDLKSARAHNIDVTNIPSYGTDSVAQSVFAHILNLTNKVEEHSIAVHNGDWVKSPDICFCIGRLTELANLTLGIIGYGTIGKAVAKIAKAFNMNVIVHSPSLTIGDNDDNAKFVSTDDILKNSDIISLNCPLNDNTFEIINKDNIEKCKDGVWIINTGRGPLINESDLAIALESGKVGACGIDVLSVEPPVATNPMLSAKNAHITPHNVWTTYAARKRLINIAYDNISAWLNGKKKNIIN